MQLYRAVSFAELQDIRAHGGAFRDSRNKTGEKAFFYDLESAMQFAASMQRMLDEAHVVVRTEASSTAIECGRLHTAAREGPGVYLLISDLDQLTAAVEV